MDKRLATVTDSIVSLESEIAEFDLRIASEEKRRRTFMADMEVHITSPYLSVSTTTARRLVPMSSPT